MSTYIKFWVNATACNLVIYLIMHCTNRHFGTVR